MTTTRRAAVVGTGLIGGSIGLGLRARGWHVTGTDRDVSRAERARDGGAIDEVGVDPDAELTFVATPVGSVIPAVREALRTSRGVVTDVGSVKSGIATAIDDPRFCGGHPMAGSEQDGIEGADAELFEGAVWVLTPGTATSDDAFGLVRQTVLDLGADAVTLAPDRHDALVAVVSHVPHLTAATLMRLADARADEHAVLLRLAAGGFRDMTRVAAGHPGIWPDICGENRQAIVEVLDALVEGLGEVRATVAADDRGALLEHLEAARSARQNLPSRYTRPSLLSELHVPVPDRPGVLAEITLVATDLSVNIADIEIAHSAEGPRGVVVLVVEAERASTLVAALAERGYKPSLRPLG